MPSFILLMPVCLWMDRASCHCPVSTTGRESTEALQPRAGRGAARPPWEARAPATMQEIPTLPSSQVT